MTVTVDKYTRFLLTVIAVLLTVVAVGMWCETDDMTPRAQAKIPDSGMQFQQLIDQTEAIKLSLANLSELLVSGKVKVRIVEAETVEKPVSTVSQEAIPAAAK